MSLHSNTVFLHSTHTQHLALLMMHLRWNETMRRKRRRKEDMMDKLKKKKKKKKKKNG